MTNVQDILSVAAVIFNSPEFLTTINAKKSMGDRRDGLYLCILIDGPTGVDEPPLALVSFGEISRDKKQKYFDFSQEKARRLQNSPPGTTSSWQTRNEQEDKWGGAIRSGNFVLSTSGLPELADEVFGLLIATSCKLAPLEHLREGVAKLSGSDKLFEEILIKMCCRFQTT